MKPAYAAREDRFPVKVARLEARRCLIRAIIENDGCTHAVPAIAIDRGHIRPGDTIMLEPFVERPNPHRPDTLGDQIADRIIHHCRYDARAQTKTVRQGRGSIELAAA